MTELTEPIGTTGTIAIAKSSTGILSEIMNMRKAVGAQVSAAAAAAVMRMRMESVSAPNGRRVMKKARHTLLKVRILLLLLLPLGTMNTITNEVVHGIARAIVIITGTGDDRVTTGSTATGTTPATIGTIGTERRGTVNAIRVWTRTRSMTLIDQHIATAASIRSLDTHRRLKPRLATTSMYSLVMTDHSAPHMLQLPLLQYSSHPQVMI